MPLSVNEGLWRVGAQYGQVLGGDPPRVLAEVVEINATVEVNRIEMPLVGSTRQGYKPGREAREGTFRIQKVDSFWELFVHQNLSQNLEARRAARAAGQRLGMKPFNLQIELNDPDALGVESWMLEGCLVWRLPLGFNIGDDLVDRELPFTWEREKPTQSFVRAAGAGDADGFPNVSQFDSSNPLTGQNYPTLSSRP